MSARLTVLTVLAALAITLIGLGVSAAPAHGTGDEVEVRVAAQRLADGRTEFALQERRADGEWGERRLPLARFFPADTRVGRWLGSSPLTVRAPGASEGAPGLEVRVAAQLLLDGRMEFALQERQADGAWGERRLPRARFFPADARVRRWLVSSPLTVVTVPAPPDGTPESDRAALVALYEATDGANWGNSTNWLTDRPIGGWHGVTTNDGGRVTVLDLAREGLRGTIPVELGGLTRLRVLDLSHNRLRGTIPVELGGLTNLEVLDFRGTDLSGPIPTELGNLTNLEFLDLAFNDLSGPIPAVLGNLINLELLDLGWNKLLNGPIPAELGNLTNLELLDLGYNALGSSIPATLGNLINLEELDLAGNELSGPIPGELGNLNNLELLHLYDNELSGPIPAELGDLAKLDDLDLFGNELSGPLPADLGNLTRLRRLRLDWNHLSGSLPAELGGLANLRSMWLSRNELSGPIPVELGNLTNLKTLDLGHNQLSGPIPAELGRLTKLRWLLLGTNELSGPIPPELGGLVDLESLSLDYNRLRGQLPPELGKLASLLSLSLRGNELSGPIPAELGDLTRLDYLALGWNRLSGSIPVELGGLVNLRVLTLNGNELSGQIPAELGNLINLERLDLEGPDPRAPRLEPAWLSDLTAEERLLLGRNQFSGCIPDGLRYAPENDLDQLELQFCGAAGTPAPGAERAALVAFYNATNGAGWLNSTNWLTDEPIGEWHGATLDGGGRVMALDLHSNQLSGSLPAELADLTGLRTLDLGWNELGGSLPAALARIHRSKLEGAGCRAAGAFGGRAGVRRAVPERGAVAQDRSGALRARARGCARRARACWREPRTRVGAVSERQAGSGSARNRARAAAHWPAQGQRFARCRVQRRAEWVSRPARAK